jgi:hypothetical protein
MADLGRYNIAHRQLNSYILEPYRPNEAAYTYVAAVIDIAQAILNHRRTKEVLVGLALNYDRVGYQSGHFRNDYAAAWEWIEWFVGHLIHKFPPVVVDFTIEHPDCLAYHQRMPWSGRLQEFDFRTRAGIHLNGEVRLAQSTMVSHSVALTSQR